MNRAVRYTTVMDALQTLLQDGKIQTFSTTYIASKAVFDVVPLNANHRTYRFTTMEAYAFALGVLSQ